MKVENTDALLEAVAALRQVFPEWRFGQLVANLLTAAGCQEVESIWDVEDEHLLSAAQRLIANNGDRRTIQAG